LVSLGVALIVYGRYNYFDEAVRSIATQTRLPDEVVVFTDNKAVIENILNKYKIRADVYEEPGLPLPATYARIGEVSRTDYVLPLEDDDIFKPNKLEVIEKYCGEHPLIKHSTELIDEKSNVIGPARDHSDTALVITRKNAWKICMFHACHVWPFTFALKTSFLRKYKDILYELKLHADFALFTLALLEGSVLYTPEKLTYYRIGSGHSQLTSCEKLPKLVCTWNKYAYDDYYLLRHIEDKHIKKYVLPTYMHHLLNVYLLNSITDCQYKYERSYFHVMLTGVNYVLGYLRYLFSRRNIPLKLGLAAIAPLMGRTKTGNIYRNNICKRYTR